LAFLAFFSKVINITTTKKEKDPEKTKGPSKKRKAIRRSKGDFPHQKQAPCLKTPPKVVF
jgi:hypothetical protein